jgi:hydrogenase maturation protein HypF
MPRRAVTVWGQVQGVGFRPFAYQLACRFGLGGFVRNQGGNVLIEVEGEDQVLNSFLVELSLCAPPLARIYDVNWLSKPELGERGFSIEPSQLSTADSPLISPDIATCDQCLAEMVDAGDRRFAYAFLNCTNCGPRLTIITAAPYDRPRTTMAAFAMCAACRQEYEDPSNRRFHAQPIACPACGPSLRILDSDGRQISGADPVNYAGTALARGMIGAVKSLGGYHLVCDARTESAVAKLRERKHRDAKPFAIMVRDLTVARRIGELSAEEEALLTSRARPIVLLRRRPSHVAASVAPRNPYLGIMLPYTPLHHLLTQAVNDMPLVMTSGNWSDEPIAYDDGDAVAKLRGLADFFVTHDRPIQIRCDDSVMRVVAGRPLPLRRSRGFAPAPIELPFACLRPILALGGQLKATFALGRDRHASMSHHLGDLDHFEAYRAFVEAIEHYKRLFANEPECIVHELHPDYASTRYAYECCQRTERLAVQHHHAHLASCLAEHGLDEAVIGVIFDGTGYGPDGAVWGGEFLIGGYRGYRRAAHLRYVPMPGGEQAIREPWRMAVSHVMDAKLNGTVLEATVTGRALDTVRQMIQRQINSPATSSAGRLFDAVAALTGVRHRVEYEGQAATELEWLADETPTDGSYPFDLQVPADEAKQPPIEIDTRPLIAAVADDVRRGISAGLIARRFHTTMVEIIASVCKHLRDQTRLESVALSGGVFMNALLLSEVVPRLTELGFRVYRHQRVPPNDGGLCLGQLAIAAALQNQDNAKATDEHKSSVQK